MLTGVALLWMTLWKLEITLKASRMSLKRLRAQLEVPDEVEAPVAEVAVR